jgi:hypothetical protein
MIKINDKMILNAKYLILVLLTIQITLCTGKVLEKSVIDTTKIKVNTQALILKQSTTFPQIHTNLNGMVREFVRSMHQDKKGQVWFGSWQGKCIFDGEKFMLLSYCCPEKSYYKQRGPSLHCVTLRMTIF